MISINTFEAVYLSNIKKKIPKSAKTFMMLKQKLSVSICYIFIYRKKIVYIKKPRN